MPVQVIKASRKMRDLGRLWLLHYLSAKVCWGLAWLLMLPLSCLYEQPLIDHWPCRRYDDFKEWISPP